jgi:hypothetical protein
MVVPSGQLFGFVEYGISGGDRGGFDAGDCVGSHTEFVHSVARVAGVVSFTEDKSIAGDEGSDMFVVVLATCIGEEGEFRNAGVDVLACGCMGCEACVALAMVGCVRKGKIR